MKKTKKGLSTKRALMTGAAIITLGAAVVPEAQAAPGTGAMTAIVLTPITVTASVLHFGSFTDGGGGNVVIPTDGTARTTTGPILVTGAAAETRSIITITGAAAGVVDVVMAATTDTVINGGPTMNVNNFHLATVAGGTSQPATIGGGGTVTMPLGATLTVAAAQAVGTYTGAFALTVNYQ